MPITSTVTANATTTTQTITSGTTPTLWNGPTGQQAWVATIGYTGVAFLPNQPVTISGATPSGLNGTWYVISSTANSVTLNFRGTNPGLWTSGGTAASTAAGQYAALSTNVSPMAVGLGCIVSGTVTYTVQHTYDDVFDPTVNPTWIDEPSSGANAGINGATASQNGSILYPARAVRVNTTAGTGSVVMRVVQGVGY